MRPKLVVLGLAAVQAALAGATLLAGERIVRVEDSDLFVKHVDKGSGVVSYILRPGLAADNQQSLYFTAKSMTDDGRFLVFWISDNEFTFKPTKERPERLMGTAVLDLQKGTVTRIPVPPQIPFLDVRTARLWYISPSPATLLPHCDWRPSETPWNDEIRYIDLAVDPTAEHTVCRMPKEIAGPGHSVDVYSTHLTLSHDRKRMFLGVFVDGRHEQGCVNLETGAWEKWAATRELNTNHDQINPVRDDVALVASDNCWTLPKAIDLMKLSGWYPRVWIVRRDGRRELQPIRIGRYATHENWNQDGSGLYWCGNAGVVRQDLETGAQECVAPRKAAHATMSYDMRYVTFDAAVDRWWRGCPWRVSFWNRDAGRGIYIHTENEALCDKPGCPRWHDHPDPHPQFVCRDRYIVCTVNHADGHMDLSVTPVAQLVERTAAGDSACFGPDPERSGLEGKPLWFEQQEEGRLRREVPYLVNAGMKRMLKRRWELVRDKAEAALDPACDPTEARYSLYTALLTAETLDIAEEEGPARWHARLAAVGGVPAGLSEVERHHFLLTLPESLKEGRENDAGLTDGAYQLLPSDGSAPAFSMTPTPLGFQLTMRIRPGCQPRGRIRSHNGWPFVLSGDWKVRDARGRTVPTRRTRFGECVFETDEFEDYTLEAVAAGGTLTLRPGGSVRLPDDPEGFIPTLKVDGTSLTAFGRTAATAEGVRYDFIRRGVAWAHGFAMLGKTADGARVTWTFELCRDAAKVEFGTICSLDVGRFPPSSFDIGTKGEVRIRDLTARLPDGCRAECGDGRWFYPFHACYNISVRAPSRANVRKGEKLTFSLDFSAPAPLALAFAGPYVADETTGWVRMNHLKGIRPGSALDFSGFGLQDAPAGKYGWLRMSDGEAQFEGKPGFSPRFCGVNFCGEANYPRTPDEAEARAERLRLLGYNTLRIHHHDNLFARYEDGRLVLNAENADRLDRLVDACIRRGIYLTTDLYVSRRVSWKDIGVDRAGNVPVKTWQLVTERGWRDWCNYARLFMAHRNPYTGRTYADEPAMPFVCIQNETAFSDFTLFPEQKELWGEFLREARAKTPGAFPGFSPDRLPSNGLWWDAHAETSVKSAYWAFLERRFIGRATKFLREELGVKAFLTGDNFGPTPAFVQEMRADVYGYSDAHLYETGWWEWLGKGAGYSRPMKIKHLNPLHRKSMPPESYAFNRIWGQPSCVSEWDYVGPDSYRSPGGLIFGTIAAVQGWTGIWRFAYEHGERNFADNCGMPELYNLSRDPLKLASDRVTTLLYLRRDMPEAKEALSLDFGDKALDPTKPLTYLSAPNWLRSGVAFSHRVGVSVRRRNVPPGARVFAQDEVNALKEPPLEVKVPDTVAIDRIGGTFAVNTPRTIGIFTPGAGTFAVGGHGVRTSGGATVFVSALDGRDIVASARLLVTHLTDALGKGATYMDDAAHILLSEGVVEQDAAGEKISPIVLRKGTAELVLKVDRPERFAAYALESDGRRAAEVPVSVRDGHLVLNLSVEQCFGGCMLYELVRTH